MQLHQNTHLDPHGGLKAGPLIFYHLLDQCLRKRQVLGTEKLSGPFFGPVKNLSVQIILGKYRTKVQ